ncbi:MAG TPA: neutral zinc metallopeptidase [Caulobacterales bacterium]|nr:neutral zinc metallopeptidase [Caulobacterales bacterium]
MRLDNQRESSNFEDRGRGAGGASMGGLGAYALFGIFRMLGLRGIIIVLLIIGGIYFFAPNTFHSLFGGAGGGGQQVAGQGSVCATQAQACDFARKILASTEDVWHEQFRSGRLPRYGAPLPGDYSDPTLVVYQDNVSTGCGDASSSIGPFYCPNDNKLYLDPSFYQVMADRLHAPGDFAQAYVIAHEVGHHVQNLIGATDAGPQESQNEHSVRIELQADCFAGVWGHTAAPTLAIDDADLREALNAAHQIGDDALQQGAQGHVDPNQFTHGTSAQRMRWFRRGFDSGDARQCDTMQGRYQDL